MARKNKILLFFAISLSVIVFTSLFGGLYEKFFGPISSGFWGPAHPENLIGFILSFLFFGSLFSWLFVTDKKIKYWLSYILPFLVFMLMLGAFEELIIGLGLVIVGWLLAQGILLIYNKFSIKQSSD